MAWACLLSPPNLLHLAIKKEKIITKQKALATSADGNKKFPGLLYLPYEPRRCKSSNKR